MSTSIEWTRGDDGAPGKTWNPLVGCQAVSPGCDHCLAPETRVLTLTGEQLPIGSVRVGDRLLGFDDELPIGVNRSWRAAEVLAVWHVIKPTVTLTFEDGREVTASADHKWLSKTRPYWRTTDSFRLGQKIQSLAALAAPVESPDYMRGYVWGATAADGTFRHGEGVGSGRNGTKQGYWRVAEPGFDVAILERLKSYLAKFDVPVEIRSLDTGDGGFMPASGVRQPMLKVETRSAPAWAAIAAMEHGTSHDWCAGFLAGMFDCDGGHHGSVRISQLKPNDLLDRCIEAAAELGFDMRRENHKSCPTVRLYGDSAEKARFFSRITPALGRKALVPILGENIAVRRAEIVGIRRGPDMELVDITTSTGTFIAAGLLTHNCYAATVASRQMQPAHEGLTIGRQWNGTVRLLPERLDEPLRWRKPRRVFVGSMTDLFYREVPDEYIAEVFAVMALAQRHTFQVLTKRPQRMAALLADDGDGDSFVAKVEAAIQRRHPSAPITEDGSGYLLPGVWDHDGMTWPLPNVWCGTSIESDRYAWRADHLRATPSAVRFLSLEPLLGPLPSLDLTGIDWVITGGESGPGARPMHPDWVRDLRDRCVHEGVPFFFKQHGEWTADPHEGRGWVDRLPGEHRARVCFITPDGEVTPGPANGSDSFPMAKLGKKAAGRDLDGRTWNEFPRSAS